ncbi:DUF341 domain protein [Cordyceps militaris CM01]|uniref:DUF341 domain protein n=1 Tax=Cordyceps militaris (strain CM01) TaxID=983644 RepID=G3J5K3_CORMM|nr:DUF341 domain protein [Cordyceps militaris CM01]EGX96859.1 DUF341 domain protein [Cordyceps militaris CM01]
MRFIGLHGVGSSGSICESQFVPLMKAADPSYEFVFVDGPIEFIRGPGMGAQFNGPFFSHAEGYSPKQMRNALDHLEAAIDQLGPFDGVVGFSQGAALAVAYMHDQVHRTGQNPFKVAFLFSTVCAFSPNPDQSLAEIQGLCKLGRELGAATEAQPDKGLSSSELALYEALSNVIKPLRDGHALLPDIDLDLYTKGDGAEAPRLLLPQLMDRKLSIPSIHVHGKKDAQFMRDMSLIARAMFDPKMIKTLEHSGTHHPPQKDSEVRAAVRAMEWAIEQHRKLELSR